MSTVYVEKDVSTGTILAVLTTTGQMVKVSRIRDGYVIDHRGQKYLVVETDVIGKEMVRAAGFEPA